MAENKLSFTMLIDKKENKVLFAEAGKEFVDFLFLLLSLPVGTIIRLLKSTNMFGSLESLYQSLESLNEDYVLPDQKKDLLLKPDNVVTGFPFRLADTSQCPARIIFYRCVRSCSHLNYVTDKPKTACPTCCQPMTGEMTFIGTSTIEKGVVKGLAKYMVMDDLTITPMSMISGIALLNKCNIKDFGELEERKVEFGMDEALRILRTSLQSKISLTDVFLVKQEVKEI